MDRRRQGEETREGERRGKREGVWEAPPSGRSRKHSTEEAELVSRPLANKRGVVREKLLTEGGEFF